MRFIVKIEDYNCGDYETKYPDWRTSRVPDVAYEVDTRYKVLRRFSMASSYSRKFKEGFVLNKNTSADEAIKNMVSERVLQPFDYNDKKFKEFINGAISYTVKMEADARPAARDDAWIVEAIFPKKVFMFETDNLEEFVKIVSECSNSIDAFNDIDFEFKEGQEPDYCITFM